MGTSTSTLVLHASAPSQGKKRLPSKTKSSGAHKNSPPENQETVLKLWIQFHAFLYLVFDTSVRIFYFNKVILEIKIPSLRKKKKKKPPPKKKKKKKKKKKS